MLTEYYKTSNPYEITISPIMKINFYYEEYIMGAREKKKVEFIFNKTPVTEMIIEFISYVYFFMLVSKKHTRPGAIKHLSEFVVNLDIEILEKHYKNYVKLYKKELDGEITLFEYEVFNKFNKLGKNIAFEALIKVLTYLNYNKTITIRNILI